MLIAEDCLLYHCILNSYTFIYSIQSFLSEEAGLDVAKNFKLIWFQISEQDQEKKKNQNNNNK